MGSSFHLQWNGTNCCLTFIKGRDKRNSRKISLVWLWLEIQFHLLHSVLQGWTLHKKERTGYFVYINMSSNVCLHLLQKLHLSICILINKYWMWDAVNILSSYFYAVGIGFRLLAILSCFYFNCLPPKWDRLPHTFIKVIKKFSNARHRPIFLHSCEGNVSQIAPLQKRWAVQKADKLKINKMK